MLAVLAEHARVLSPCSRPRVPQMASLRSPARSRPLPGAPGRQAIRQHPSHCRAEDSPNTSRAQRTAPQENRLSCHGISPQKSEEQCEVRGDGLDDRKSGDPSQTVADPSVVTARSRHPSALKARPSIELLGAVKVRISLPVAASQILMAWSSAAEADGRAEVLMEDCNRARRVAGTGTGSSGGNRRIKKKATWAELRLTDFFSYCR